jgi:Lrp/AsnC family leucine-responsive transcriptional regulator
MIKIRKRIGNTQKRSAALLDSFDIKLLNLVQTDTRRTAQELSEAVGLSPSACLRRLNRLRETGVIEAEIAVVSPAAVGHRLTMVVEVSLERERPDIMSDFKKAMRMTPEVIQCYYVTGEVDFILIVAVKSMSDYETFTNDFLFNNKNIKRFNTLVVMDRVKVSLAVPIE